MKNYEFIVWLEGYLDLCPDDRLDVRKLRIVRNHLILVKAVAGAFGSINTEIFSYVYRLIEKGDPVPEDALKVLYRTIEPLLLQSASA